jgi:hypothetical protein
MVISLMRPAYILQASPATFTSNYLSSFFFVQPHQATALILESELSASAITRRRVRSQSFKLGFDFAL